MTPLNGESGAATLIRGCAAGLGPELRGRHNLDQAMPQRKSNGLCAVT